MLPVKKTSSSVKVVPSIPTRPAPKIPARASSSPPSKTPLPFTSLAFTVSLPEDHILDLFKPDGKHHTSLSHPRIGRKDSSDGSLVWYTPHRKEIVYSSDENVNRYVYSRNIYTAYELPEELEELLETVRSYASDEVKASKDKNMFAPLVKANMCRVEYYDNPATARVRPHYFNDGPMAICVLGRERNIRLAAFEFSPNTIKFLPASVLETNEYSIPLSTAEEYKDSDATTLVLYFFHQDLQTMTDKLCAYQKDKAGFTREQWEGTDYVRKAAKEVANKIKVAKKKVVKKVKKVDKKGTGTDKKKEKKNDKEATEED